MSCNDQPVVAKALHVVRFLYEDRGKVGPPIAKINPDRRLLAVPVNWKHMTGCGGWSFDRRTWNGYRRRFDLVHFHLRHGDGRSLIYATAANMMETSGHSSWRCDDEGRDRPERLHMEKTYMHYDREIEATMTPPEPAKQGSLLP